MVASYRKARVKNASFRRLILIVASGIVLFVLLVWANTVIDLVTGNGYSSETNESLELRDSNKNVKMSLNLPKQTEFSISLEKRNQMPPRNLDLYPKLSKDHIVIVLYVHNRPQYLRIVVDSLSRVLGISETLLIVSHDGFFEEMNGIVESIKFCQVKQIFAPYSPHVFPNSFPGISPFDCREKDDHIKMKCDGTPDQYGNHRSPKIVSLKHHWWWMMNTVWDGLKETKGHFGHILFIEEDHFIYPNAYRNLQTLVELKPQKCPYCYAVNLAPSDVKSRGERWDTLVAEMMGNVGYSFNSTVWRKIHRKAREFCFFDDYNWDITMWATVYPSFGGAVFSLRGPRTSAIHFGKCGLHQGHGDKSMCIDNGHVNIEVGDVDKVPNIKSNWDLYVYKRQAGYKAGFKGWGGWGDIRDRQMCLNFAKMYWAKETRTV